MKLNITSPGATGVVGDATTPVAVGVLVAPGMLVAVAVGDVAVPIVKLRVLVHWVLVMLQLFGAQFFQLCVQVKVPAVVALHALLPQKLPVQFTPPDHVSPMKVEPWVPAELKVTDAPIAGLAGERDMVSRAGLQLVAWSGGTVGMGVAPIRDPVYSNFKHLASAGTLPNP